MQKSGNEKVDERVSVRMAWPENNKIRSEQLNTVFRRNIAKAAMLCTVMREYMHYLSQL